MSDVRGWRTDFGQAYLPTRHCERSEAIRRQHKSQDWIASLRSQ